MNSTCKECIHYDACKEWNTKFIDERVKMGAGCICKDFKDKDRFIELPCAVGDSCYPLNASETELTCEEKISRITISERNIIIGYYEHWDYYNRCRKTDNWRLPLRTRILGKGVFLTKEDAEKALSKEFDYVKAKDFYKDCLKFKAAVKRVKRL